MFILTREHLLYFVLVALLGTLVLKLDLSPAFALAALLATIASGALLLAHVSDKHQQRFNELMDTRFLTPTLMQLRVDDTRVRLDRADLERVLTWVTQYEARWWWPFVIPISTDGRIRVTLIMQGEQCSLRFSSNGWAQGILCSTKDLRQLASAD
ncbi:hypothetical protein [Deinococcus gobiensis]|nr:hypothetical protein [Deinococcus gobiensis]